MNKLKLTLLVLLTGLFLTIHQPVKAGPLVDAAEKIEEVTPKVWRWLKETVGPAAEKARKESIKVLEKAGE